MNIYMQPAHPLRQIVLLGLRISIPEGLRCFWVLLLYLFVLLLPSQTVALDTLQVVSSEPILEDRFWTTFDKSSGYLGRGKGNLFEDREGNIWVATETGAFQKYDGFAWTTYQVSDGLFERGERFVTQSQDGAMWFVGRDGVHRFDGSEQTEQDAWTHFDNTHFHGVGFDTTRTPIGGAVFATKDGAVWFGTGWTLEDSTEVVNLGRYQNGQWEKITVSVDLPHPRGILEETRDGALWFGTTDAQGVLRYHNGTWTHITMADGLGGDFVYGMLEAEDGSLWFSHHARKEDGVSRYYKGQWHIYTDFNWRVGMFWQDHDGVVWVSGLDAQLFRFEGNRWLAVGRSRRFGHAAVGLPVKDGSIWFRDLFTDNSKIQRFDLHHNWVKYTFPGGLSGGFEWDDGSVWFHTQKQAVQFHEGVWIGYGPEDGFLDGEVYGLHKTSQALWFIGTHQGHHAVARYENSAWRIFTAADGLIDEVYKPRRLQRITAGVDFTFLKTVVETRDGSVWFLGKHEGDAAVCRWDGNTFKRYTTADGLVGEWTHVAHEASDGSMWFGTWQSGVSYDERGKGLYRFDGSGFTRFTKSDGLSGDLVIDISEWPKGTLWVGTELGLDRMDMSAQAITWQSKIDFGIMRPKPRSFVPTPDALWFGFLPNRQGGVIRYDGKVWTSFKQTVGLAGNSVSHIVQNVGGTLWFAGQEGI
ncbi:MAG: hypothetical protein HN521_09645, partial [Candidatus Latescibacteria bacterium]|nr:hypothetical protein [Candidatus Latescibacterota bacterium]